MRYCFGAGVWNSSGGRVSAIPTITPLVYASLVVIFLCILDTLCCFGEFFV